MSDGSATPVRLRRSRWPSSTARSTSDWRRVLVLGHHACSPRPAGHRERAGGRSSPRTRRLPCVTVRAHCWVSRRRTERLRTVTSGAGRHARRRAGRHPRAQRAGADGVRCARPCRRGRRGRWSTRSPGATSISAISTTSSRVCAPPSSHRSGPWSATSACATSRGGDRLDELGFEIPLVGGDDADGVRCTSSTTSPTCWSSTSTRDDPVARYADRLRDPALQGVLRGYLTGSLDLVFRLARRPVRASPTTRRTGSPRPTRRSRPGTTGPRRSRPRWWRPTIRCRRCSTPWRCTGTCAGACRVYDPAAAPRRCPLPLRARHERRWRPRSYGDSPAVSGRGGRRPRWSSR